MGLCYVTDACVNCKYTDCAAACPVDAFREGANILVIDPGTCIDCKACIPVCPTEAIYDDDSRPIPGNLAEWKDLNARLAGGWPTIPASGKKAAMPNADALNPKKNPGVGSKRGDLSEAPFGG